MNLNCISDRFQYIFLLSDIRKQFPQFKALAHYKDFHKDFSEKIFVKIVVHI